MPEQVCLTINGRQVSGDAGRTILELAVGSGIHIPHLCAQEGLTPFGACGLCLVEALGNPRLVRACSTVAVSGMMVNSETLRVRRTRAAALELMLSDHEGECTAPCALACPAHVDCQQFLKALSGGDLKRAAAVLLDRLPLPASIGRVCAHPREAACRRRFVEEPLSIAALQVFVAEENLNSPHPVQSGCLSTRANQLRWWEEAPADCPLPASWPGWATRSPCLTPCPRWAGHCAARARPTCCRQRSWIERWRRSGRWVSAW